MNNSIGGPLARYVQAYRDQSLGEPVEELRYEDQESVDKAIALEKGLYYHYDRLDNSREDAAPAEDDLVIIETPLYGLRATAILDSDSDPLTGNPTDRQNLLERVQHNGRELHLNAYHFSGQQISSLEVTARGQSGAVIEERLLVSRDPAASIYRRWHL